MAAQITTHPKVSPSVEIGASARVDSHPDSDVLVWRWFTSIGLYVGGGTNADFAGDSDVEPAALGCTKAATCASCITAKMRAMKARDLECSFFNWYMINCDASERLYYDNIANLREFTFPSTLLCCTNVVDERSCCKILPRRDFVSTTGLQKNVGTPTFNLHFFGVPERATTRVKNQSEQKSERAQWSKIHRLKQLVQYCTYRSLGPTYNTL